MHPLRLSMFALLLLAVLGLSQEAEAERNLVVEVYVGTYPNNELNLTTIFNGYTLDGENDLEIIIRLSGPYRMDTGDDNLSVHSITIQMDFLNYESPRNSLIGFPEYQPLSENEDDPGYDEYRSKFHSNKAFEDYYGDVQIVIAMGNNSGDIIVSESFAVAIVPPLGNPESSISSDDTDNILLIAAGIAGAMILGGGAVIISRKKTQDPYALPESDDNNYPTSYENDRHSNQVVKQIKMLEDSEMDKETNGDDKFTKLQDLKTMLKEGLIDEKEFNKLKKEILD